jgi:hypothetical protein
MNDIFYFLFAGIGFVFVLIFLFNFMSNGFFLAWFKGKSSRGKKILIIMKTKLSYYPAFGRVEGDSFVFTDHETKKDSNNKIHKRLRIPQNKSPFFRLFNIWITIIDESNGTFINIEQGGNTTGFDPIFQESLIMRALIRPTFEQKKTIFFIIIILILVIVLILAIITLVKVGSLPALIRPSAAGIHAAAQAGGQVINGTIV